jgi:hypothetical protein
LGFIAEAAQKLITFWFPFLFELLQTGDRKELKSSLGAFFDVKVYLNFCWCKK